MYNEVKIGKSTLKFAKRFEFNIMLRPVFVNKYQNCCSIANILYFFLIRRLSKYATIEKNVPFQYHHSRFMATI